MRDHIRVVPGQRNVSAMPREMEFDDGKLLVLLQSASRELQGVRMVHVHTSCLENYESNDSVSITRIMEEVASNSGHMQLFNISNGDIIMFYKALKFSAVEEACKKIAPNLG